MDENEKQDETKSEVMPTENEPVKEPSYTEAVNELREQFNKRVSDMQADFNAKLHEREALINQLLNEVKTEPVSETNSDLISRIDERRKRSKF